LKTYDALFIFDESLEGAALDAVLARIGQEVTRLGGTLGIIDKVGRQSFARPMKKRTHGQYVWITFDMAPEHMTALRGRFRLVEEIFRMQIEHGRPRTVPVETAPEETAHGQP
jgi:ribosomal protein S6